jgi:hypothetical protein
VFRDAGPAALESRVVRLRANAAECASRVGAATAAPNMGIIGIRGQLLAAEGRNFSWLTQEGAAEGAAR